MNDSNFFSFHISDLRMLAKPIDNYDVLCGCVRESRRFKASVLRHQVFRYALLFRLSKINFTKGWNGAKTASLLFIPRTRGVLSLSVPFFFFLPATRRATKQSCWRRKMSFQMIQTVCDVCQIWSCQKKGDPFTRSKLSFAFFPLPFKDLQSVKDEKAQDSERKRLETAFAGQRVSPAAHTWTVYFYRAIERRCKEPHDFFFASSPGTAKY